MPNREPHLRELHLGPMTGSLGNPRLALHLAEPHSDYLSGLVRRLPEVVEQLSAGAVDAMSADILARMERLAHAGEPADAVMAAMRRCKAEAHLVTAAADLSGVWSLERVTKALSDLGDAAVNTAMQQAVRGARLAGRLDGGDPDAPFPGFFAIAMGKMGAGELNYSSDVDLIVLFDPDRIPLSGSAAKEASLRLTREMVRLLEARTVDGYVFRTDLRLRPDPASTAIALSTHFALGYYESIGQNWERMAHIKARPCAGDRDAAKDYLDQLIPYVWRRHLDYWAIADVHSIKRQIHAEKGHPSLSAAEFDVKLGRGGVREIEFFVQVQQLILGGRFEELRTPATKMALRALAARGVVEPDVCEDLLDGYDFLRALEHRIQMLNDEQTHLLPSREETRNRVSVLCGYGNRADFEVDITSVRTRVHAAYSDLFAREERLSGEAGNLVFTGVDDDPGTVATLAALGFSDPSRVIRTLQGWHRGGIAATRSARGQQLLTTLGPRLLRAMAETGEPDAAFDRFAEFFSVLKGGVQAMSLMLAEPALTADILRTMAFAPQLAADLARRPVLLDVMLDPRFQVPVSEDRPGDRETALGRLLDAADGFEARLNAARRFHREEAFRIGYQLLRGRIRSVEAGRAYADLADACVRGLAKAAEGEVLSKFGGQIGPWAVCAMGKFGGKELAATSDLDLMLVFEPAGEESGQLAARFVQRLVAALSVPTEEGELYEVDMQLRPSGRAGPVAVQASAFEAYYRGSAWTWEFMALTRLRPMAGDRGLCVRIADAARAALALKSADPAITADILDMRRRMARERPPTSTWDLKLAPGGLVDIEFIVQHELLKVAGEAPGVIDPTTLWSIEGLATLGRLQPEEARLLRDALTFQLDLQQALRIACGKEVRASHLTPGLASWLCALMDARDLPDLAARLAELQSQVVALRELKLGPIATDR
jgi:[glutamine synthetase] adenylyltransferase / [glutamine synthetase]-adenylyl-L-tyrosine phosphorylase